MPRAAEPGAIEVALPKGAVTVSTLSTSPSPSRPWVAVALAHGAGAGMTHPFLEGFARALTDADVTVLRFAFPYAEAGRRMPGPAAHAVATWQAVMPALGDIAPGVPLIAAGKSYGGRMASVAAAEGAIAPAGLLYLGYPLHPPGEPEKMRASHLPLVTAPQLFVSGTRDPFVQPVSQLADAVGACPDAEVLWIDGGGHSFEVAGARRAPEVTGAELAASVLPWLRARFA
ncbi:alpha/beta hydrolase family protein [Microbacterium aurum]